jgi:hypothetical protein
MSTDEQKYPRTISEELHKTWTTLRRRKDADVIAEKTGRSRPLIDRALKYGYVATPELTSLITEFFEQRIEAENRDAARLNKKAAELK